MDQNIVGCVRCQRFQTHAHGILAPVAADDRGRSIRTSGLGIKRFLARTDHHPDWPTREGIHCPAHHGAAQQRFILLGPGPAGAFPFSGGDDQDGDA